MTEDTKAAGETEDVTASPVFMNVVDLNCRRGVSRKHEMVDEEGDLHVFELSLVPTRVPEYMARKFAAADRSFKVTTDSGQIVHPPIAENEAGRFVLKGDECVAKYDELTIDALLDRAHRFPDGAKLRRNHGKEAIADFLISKGNVDAPARAPVNPATKTPPPQRPRMTIEEKAAQSPLKNLDPSQMSEVA